MTWESILKNIQMNRQKMCCEEARQKIVNAFEEAIADIGTPKHLDKMVDDNFRNWANKYIKAGASASLDDFIKEYNKGNREALESTVTILSEESCDELYNSLERFVDLKDGFKRGWMGDLFDYDELQDILAEWDNCRKEPEMEKPKETSVPEIFESNPVQWMDKYIRRKVEQ